VFCFFGFIFWLGFLCWFVLFLCFVFFCGLGKCRLFGLQATAVFICYGELTEAEFSYAAAAGVQWERLFSQSLSVELLTFIRKSLLNIGEKKVRDGD